MGMVRKERGNAPVFEVLEPRLLLSGDPFDTTGIIESDPALAEMLAAEAERFVSGEFLIKLKEQAGSFGGAPTSVVVADDTADPGQPTSHLADLLVSYGIESIEPVFPTLISAEPLGADPLQIVAAEGEPLDPERQDLGRWYHVELPAGVDVQEAIDAFAANPDVEVAEPNYELQFTDQIDPPIFGLPDGTTDPDYPSQWHHAAARIPNAWDYLQNNGVYPGGLRDVVVAVIDSGVDYNHEDLVGNMWVNAGEIPGNSIDDDGNGFVDDIHGCNVVSDGRSHSGDPIDLHGHGTHVAGIVASQAYNDIGGVGVAFNVQIMAIRAGQYSGLLTVEDVSEAILYATDNGADVINMSFGGYVYSQMVVDAMEVALNQAALVAGAGNDGGPEPIFPANLPYVLAVEAAETDGRRAWFSNAGDVRAPGVSILSTLPNNGYAAWSGTSMATPIISGIAALMRSFFWQSEIYSSRFNMGSIYAASQNVWGDVVVVDSHKALTEPPTPGVVVLENWLFDDEGIAEGNDGDGRADSGETLHMAIELINRSGMAENVTATLRAHAQGLPLDDPYVTITTDTIHFGNIGPWNMKDNGFIYDDEGVIIGVETPFVFEVAPDCPNDHIIPFEMTTTFQDGWDEAHKTYTRVSRFNYIVQRGRNIPTVISEDMELTSEDYWMVGGPVLIEKGATLTIREGTQVQWGAISDDPYHPGPQNGYIIVRGVLRVEGTEDRPVSLFPSYLVSGQEVKITVESGWCDISYAEIRNPELTGIRLIDHAYFQWDNFHPKVEAGTDYEAASGTVTFEPGEIEQTFTVPIIGNELYQADRTFVVNLTHPSTANLADKQGTGTILDDDILLSIDEAVVVAEGDAGTTDAVFTVSLSSPALETLSVDYMTWDGTATGGFDYQSVIGTLVFEPGGPSEQTIVVPVFGDTEAEPHEAFTLGLLNPVGAAVTDAQGEATILADDGPLLSINDVVLVEGDQEALPWSTYVGGGPSGDSGVDVAIDASGNIWTVGHTGSPAWAVGGVDTSHNGGSDAFVAKVSPEGDILWSTYLGGGGNDYARSVAVNADGSAYVVGYTNSTAWAVGGGIDTTSGGGQDGFVAKINSDGQLAWWTYLGADGSDEMHGVAVAPSGDVWISGKTTSEGWATGGFDTGYSGSTDAFVACMDPQGQVLWSSYMGSSKTDEAYGVAVDSAGDGWITGLTKSTNWISGGESSGYGGDDSAFLAKVASDGQSVLWSSFIGGGWNEIGNDVAVDAAGNGYMTGNTYSYDWSGNGGAWDRNHNGGSDGFAAKFTTDGQLTWSTFLGGSSTDAADGITVDASGDVYIVGSTHGGGWLDRGFDLNKSGSSSYRDAFVIKLTTDGKLCWSSYLGGSYHESATGVAIDAGGRAWVFGYTGSTNWIAGGPDTVLEGSNDAYLTRLDPLETWAALLTVSISESPSGSVNVDFVTADGSAADGEDYRSRSGSLRFTPGGPTQRTIVVPINGDQVHESDEVFFVDLANGGVAISDNRGSVTIENDDPVFSIDDVEIVEGNAGTTDLLFTVTLSADFGKTATVDYATSNGLALAGQDYQAVSGTLVFESGQPLTQTLAVPIIGDTVIEIDEGFLVVLADATNAEIADIEGSGTIRNDDLPVVTIDDAAFWEGDDGTTEAAFTIRLSADPFVAVSVDYDTADGSAVQYEDYTPVHGTVTWRPGEPLERTITVPIIGDIVDEGDETLAIDLSNVDHGVIDDAQAIGTILDDEPRVSIDDVTIVEGDAGSADAVFTVTLASAPDHQVTVDYATADGTAVNSADYTPVSGTLTFDPGQPTSQTIAVPVLGDMDNETNETFFVDLSGATGAFIADGQGSGMIVGDDGPLVSIADATFAEGDSGTSNQSFTISISADPPQRVVVDYTTIDGTAEAGSDYASVAATVVFDPGQPLTQTILVPVIGDTDSEFDETFTIRLTNATVVGISDDEAIGAIANDDPLISIDDVTVVEGVTGAVDMVFTVSISMDPPDTVTLDYATAEVTTTEGTDYLTASGSLTFAPGGPLTQPVTVTALGDIVNEVHETFLVELSNLVNANFTNDSGLGTITDDDGPKLQIDDVTVVAEGDSGTVDAVFTVSLTEATGQTITVDWATVDDSAVSGADYIEASGTLTFEPAGATSQQVTVTVNGDMIDEIDEVFLVELSNATGAPILDATGEGAITDDDTATLSIGDVTAAEGFDGWVNSRTWRGSFWVVPVTGEGYHLMRISGAVAADDPWLVSGYDVGRFPSGNGTAGSAFSFAINVLPGDADGNNVVGSGDYNALMGELGRRGSDLTTDFNRDGRVNLTDFAIMRGNSGNTLPAAAPVAAPASSVVPVVSQTLVNNNDASDTPIVAAAAGPAVDLLALSLSNGLMELPSPAGYISESQAISFDSSTTTPYRAATAAYDLRPLGDDLVSDLESGILDLGFDGVTADLLKEAVS